MQEKVDNWYHLLTENLGRKKHLAAKKITAPSVDKKENTLSMTPNKATPSPCVSIKQTDTPSKLCGIPRKQVITVSSVIISY